MSLLLLDVNVWVALSCAAHEHHQTAADWYSSLDDTVELTFCRITQLGLLRLLTSEAVMGDEVLTQSDAWRVYDAWRRDARVSFAPEPAGLDRTFRQRSRAKAASPKSWADAYLSAFADEGGLSLVTFDRAFRGRVESLVLLEPE
jgi:toxin-antitoxin system PIN domain toxin